MIGSSIIFYFNSKLNEYINNKNKKLLPKPTDPVINIDDIKKDMSRADTIIEDHIKIFNNYMMCNDEFTKMYIINNKIDQNLIIHL